MFTGVFVCMWVPTIEHYRGDPCHSGAARARTYAHPWGVDLGLLGALRCKH